ncbi:MAG: SdrD B-like domain-containing protein, partial [Beijerinckiaceae bacterium]|nr:SdrD B-like domain-containing protein [Beijerinckiaceae bacterium]
MATLIDLRTAGSSQTIDGAIFLDSANVGSGTGNYNTFLALSPTPSQSGNEQGFNSDDTSPIDPSNEDISASKTHTVLLSTVPIKIVDGVEYYEFRVDLNEANSGIAAQISLDQFKIYSSTSGTIESTTTLFNQNLVYDMDANGDVSLLLSEVSTGSGTDDYAVLVPVSKFAGLDPATTYMYLYVDMGSLGGDYVAASGFEEWNLQSAGTLTGIKFNDADGDGIKDAGEAGVGGVTIFIDNDFDGIDEATDNNGVLDEGERSTVTIADGTYSFYGVPLGTWQVDEVVPVGSTQTTGAFETVTISSVGQIVTVDPIGNFNPFDISGTKYIDENGDGSTDGDVGLGGVRIFIDLNGNGTFQWTDAGGLNGVWDTGEGDRWTTTASDGTWSFNDLDASYAGKKVFEVLPDGYVQTLGQAGYTITGDQSGLNFANFENIDISGVKYTDEDGDGEGDTAGTPGQSFTINLYKWVDSAVNPG